MWESGWAAIRSLPAARTGLFPSCRSMRVPLFSSRDTREGPTPTSERSNRRVLRFRNTRGTGRAVFERSGFFPFDSREARPLPPHTPGGGGGGREEQRGG